MILGLDISTVCTGIAILDNDGKLVLTDFAASDSKDLDLFDKTKLQLSIINEIIEKYDITHIFIESPLQKFRPGSSSAHTIAVLLKVNYAVSWVLYATYGIKAEFLSRSSARVGVCGTKKRGEKDKKICLDWCILNEPLFSLTMGPRGGIKPFNYDKADAIIIARAGFWKVHPR